MVEKITTEILMQFVPEGTALQAECTTQFPVDDILATTGVDGFAGPFTDGRYFLVDTFKFGVELRDGETDANKPNVDAIQALLAKSGMAKGVQKDLAKHISTAGTNAAQNFARWRSATNDSWRYQNNGNQTYSARIEEFAFTRRIDKATATLFDYCCRQKTFAFASMIKRKSAPAISDDRPTSQSYLRLDFADVQIASLSWSDDDVVEETCSFRAMKMRAQYWAEIGDTGFDMLQYVNKADWVNSLAIQGSGSQSTDDNS